MPNNKYFNDFYANFYDPFSGLINIPEKFFLYYKIIHFMNLKQKKSFKNSLKVVSYEAGKNWYLIF